MVVVAERLAAHPAGADLVRSNVELLVCSGSGTGLQAAVAASSTIPIVMWANNFDPIARGYVKSLARPGGNIICKRNWRQSKWSC